jgi:hypothetical protein
MAAGAVVGAAAGVVAEGDADETRTHDARRKEAEYEAWRNDDDPAARGERGDGP